MMKTCIKKYIFTYLIFPLQLLSMQSNNSDSFNKLYTQILPLIDENNILHTDNINAHELNTNKVDTQPTISIEFFKKKITKYFSHDVARHKNTSDNVLSLLQDTSKEVYSAARFENRETLLHKVAAAGALRAVVSLVTHYQLDPFCKDDKGNTPLYYAQNNNHQQTSSYLKDLKRTLYEKYLQEKDFPTEKELKSFKVKIRKYFTSGYTGHISNSILKMIKRTPEKIYFNARFEDEDGATVLHLTARIGAFKAVKELVQTYNFNPLVLDNNGKSPIDYVTNDYPNQSIRTWLHRNVKSFYKRLERWQQLSIPQTAAPSINTPLTSPKLILHLAAATGSLDVCKFLIEERGFSPFMLDDHGKTPLEYARENRHTEIIKYLEFGHVKGNQPLEELETPNTSSFPGENSNTILDSLQKLSASKANEINQYQEVKTVNKRCIAIEKKNGKTDKNKRIKPLQQQDKKKKMLE